MIVAEVRRLTERFIGERITELRMRRNVSECQMSLELGLSKSYVQGITSGRGLPSVRQLFNLADYFDITLCEFFDEKNHDSPAVRELIHLVRRLDETEPEMVLALLTLLRRTVGAKS